MSRLVVPTVCYARTFYKNGLHETHFGTHKKCRKSKIFVVCTCLVHTFCAVETALFDTYISLHTDKKGATMATTQKHYRLPEDVIDIIQETKAQGGFTTETEALIGIIRSYKREKEATLSDADIECIAESVTASIHEKYKKTLDRIRLASTFSERYGYIILDAVNTMLYETDQTFLMPASGEQTHIVIRESLARYKEMIEHNKQVKDNENLKRG